MRTLFVLILVLFLAGNIRADVVEPGQTNKYCVILNSDEFPEYEFYVMYQDYYYEYGYRPGALLETEIFPDSMFSAGDRGSTSFLYARHKQTQAVAKSKMEIGGEAYLDDDNVSYILESYGIKSIKGESIELQMVKVEWVYPNGTVKEKKKKGEGESAVPMGDSGSGGNVFLYISLSLFAAFSLVSFFIYRRLLTKKALAHAAGTPS